jgi:hypothetical protein
MITPFRRQYNESFSEEKYLAFLDHITSLFQYKPIFRIAETPVFVPDALKTHLFKACEVISETVCSADFKEQSQKSLHPAYQVPGDEGIPVFINMDFAITYQDGELFPKLIEIQGFPSLYFYQDAVANAYRKFFTVPESYSHLFNGLDSNSYRELLMRVVIGDYPVENVILLEIDPNRQTTRIDFLVAHEMIGIPVVCISELKKQGNVLYYKNEKGRKTQVHRIFNRVIFDELIRRTEIEKSFSFTEPGDVDWIGHPNWFFRISKYSLPFLNNDYVPETWFLSDIETMPDDLEEFVLKPLFSFSGTGVVYRVTKEILEKTADPYNYILQRKVHYARIIETPDEPAKCEIRMLLLWEPGTENPVIVNNLARLSKGDMIGVQFNKDREWVGGSVGFFSSE